jgi:membrane protein required for colicin V production
MILNWVDWVVLIILIIATILGFIKGLARQIVSLAALIVGFILAARYYVALAPSLRPAFANDTWSRLVAFLLIFIAFLFLGWIVGWIASKLMKGPLRVVDIIFGGLFGFVKGALISAVFILALLLFPVGQKDLDQSLLALPSLQLGQALIQLVPKELKEQFRQAYRNLKGEQAPRTRRI